MPGAIAFEFPDLFFGGLWLTPKDSKTTTSVSLPMVAFPWQGHVVTVVPFIPLENYSKVLLKIENNGSTVMRILGVFHPSGDPASRSYDEAKSS